MSMKTYRLNDGAYLTELDAVPTMQTIANGVGMATWVMSIDDPKCKQEYLEFGNFVVIEDGPFVWKGMIDVPRGWGGRKVRCTAYELNSVLLTTDTPADIKLRGSAGSIFVKACQYVSDWGIAKITMNRVFMGGGPHDESLGQTPLDHIQQLVARTGYSFWIDGDVINGSFQLLGNFVETRGEEKYANLNADNLEFGDEDIVTEQGRIVNVLVGVGDAMTPSTRISTLPQADAASIGQFGRRRASVTFAGNRDKATLLQNTLATLKYLKQPRKITNFKFVNRDNVFDELVGLGNLFPFDVPDVCFNDDGGFGFKGKMEILGMGKTYGSEKIELVAGEVI